MSNPRILAAAPGPTTEPAQLNPQAELYFTVALIAATVLAVVLLVVLRAWQPRRVSGPLRVEPGRPVWPLLVIAFVGVVIWLGSQMAFGVWKAFQIMAEHGENRPPEMSDFTPNDLALLATVPGVAGFVFLLAGDRLAGRWTLAWLGFDRRAVGRGVAAGLLGALIVLPLIQWVSVGLEAIYKWLSYEHPREHDLLRVIVQAPSPWAKWLLIAGAVVVAPFFEEYLFRGHLQTLLRQALLRRKPPPDGFPIPLAGAGPYAAVPPAGPPPLETHAYAPPAYVPPAQVPPAYPAYAPPPHLGPMYPPPPPAGWTGPVAGYASAATPFPPTIPPPWSRPPDPRPLPDTPGIWPAVVAVFITSLCFTIVHPMWTWPVIFVLSCFLGYAYERTGNLWACVTIHAVFNGFSTIVYLTLLH